MKSFKHIREEQTCGDKCGRAYGSIHSSDPRYEGAQKAKAACMDRCKKANQRKATRT